MTTIDSFGDTVRVVSRRSDFKGLTSGATFPAYWAFASRVRAGVRVGAAVVHLALNEKAVIETAVEFTTPNPA